MTRVTYTSLTEWERSPRGAWRERVSPPAQCIADLFKHDVLPMQNVFIPEAQDLPSVSLQQVGAGHVAGGLCVLPAIGLDDLHALHAGKIDHEQADRVLAAEFVASEPPRAKEVPQQAFSVGGVAAEIAGDRVRHRGRVVYAGEASAYVRRRDHLPRRIAARPLPLAGEVYLR